MTNLILFGMATIGLTNIILESTLFAPVREAAKDLLSKNAYEVFECHQCMGYWAGCFVGGAMFNPWHFLLYGFAGSFLASTCRRVFVLAEEYVLSQTNFNVEIDDNG